MNTSEGGKINKIFRTLLVAIFFCAISRAFACASTLPELNQSSEPYRTYDFIRNETVTLDSDMGITYGGVFTINGIDKSTNTIDFNNYSGFILTRVQTTLNLNNLTITGAQSTIGSVLYNVSSDSQVTLTNLNITSNSVNTTDNAYGGAIYTFNPLTLTNVSLRGNSATTTGNDTVAQGGAIYARDSINMIADSDNVVIVDNTTTDSSGTDNNAIYMANSNSTLNIQARNNGQIDIQDNIDGNSGYRVNITGDRTGTVGLNDSIHNAGEINVSNVNVTMADGQVKNHELNNLKIGNNVNFTVDADLANQTADTITAQNGEGTMYISGLNILSSSTANEIKLQILKDAGNIVLNIDNLSSSIYTEVEATMYNSSLLVDSLTLGTTDTTNDSIVIIGQKDVLYEMVKDNNPLHTIKNFIFNTTTEYNLTKDLEESPQETILNIYNISNAPNGVINANQHSMFKLTNPVTSVNLTDITIKNAHTDTNGSVATLSNNTATFNATNSTITDNSADGSGGAIYANGGNVNLNNTTLSQNKSGENGGAISAAGNSEIEIRNGTVTNNTASGRGGAIYTDGTVNIIADSGDTTFEGNTDSTGSNAIHAGSNGTVNLTAENNGNINMKDKITGENGYNVNVSGSANGNVNLENNIENANITQTGATLNLAHDNLLTGSRYNANGGTLNMTNGEIGNTDFSNFTLNGRTNVKVDVDLANKSMDRITADTYGSANGTINVNGMHLLSETKERRTRIYFADSPIRRNVTTPIKRVSYSRVYQYLVEYNKSDGFFTFLRGADNDYRSFAPSVLAASVAQQFGYMNQLQNYQAVMYHNDTYMTLPKSVRLSYLRNGIASEDFNSTEGVIDHLTIPEERKSIWVRPYSSFESIPFKRGPKVSAINYGILAGGESDMIELGHGFTMVYGGFLGYNGNSYHYSTVHATQQGATLGGVIYLYKGNFFNTLTANVGWMINNSDTEYGSDTMNLIMSGFADKIGYNIEIARGKVIIQPSIMFGYTFVYSTDYTTANGIKIDTDPLHAIHFIPGIKVIGNLANGWQPYACINIIANFIDKSKVTADNIQLPEMSIDPYVEYGIGLQKRWADKYSGFAQATVRNGGRRGAALLFGFRCMLGKLKTTVFEKHEDAKPQRIKFKGRKKPEIVVEPVQKQKAQKPEHKQKVKRTKEKRRFIFKIKNLFKHEKKKVLYQYNTDVSAKVVSDVYSDGVIITSLDGMNSEKMSVYADDKSHATQTDNKGVIEAEKTVQTTTAIKTAHPVTVKKSPVATKQPTKPTATKPTKPTAKATPVAKTTTQTQKKTAEKTVTKPTTKPAATTKPKVSKEQPKEQPKKTQPQKVQEEQKQQAKPQEQKAQTNIQPEQQPEQTQGSKTDCIQHWAKRLNNNETRTQRKLQERRKPTEFKDYNLEIIDFKF